MFMGLVMWIGIHVYSIKDLLHYMDDSFSYDTNPSLEYYGPYNAYYPSKQCRLLILWDDISLPHKKRKQVFGQNLNIIGFHVNLRVMSFMMPSESKKDLISAVRSFADSSTTHRHPLVEWQRMLGWINWGFKHLPLIQPALQSSYMKIRGKTNAHTSLYLIRDVIRDLMWLTDTMEASPGIFLLDSLEWSTVDADLMIYCNTCLHGLGFYAPSHNPAYYAEFTDILSLHSIFYYEALCVVSAIAWAIQLKDLPSRLLIFTDSMNMVEMFHLLSAQSGYIDLLLH